MMRLVTVLAALAWGLCIATATDACAHASLVSSQPRDGSMVAQSPGFVELSFNEAVTPAMVRLIDAAGTTRDDVAVRAVNETIRITLPDGLPPGTQVISYRVISEDGHPVGGSIVFSIGMPTAKSTAAQATPVSGMAVLIWLARIGLYLGLFVGIGGAFFDAWMMPDHRAGRTVTAAVLWLGLFSAALSLGCQGLDLLDLPAIRLITATPWQAAMTTSLGPSLLVAAAAMASGVLARRSASVRSARALSALAMAGVGICLAASGHAGTAAPRWLTRPAIFLHGVGVAYWVGALLPLLAMARARTQPLLPVLNRFSRAALPVVGVLVLTGLTLAVIQLERLHALTDTGYGRILCAKIALVLVLLGFAVLNRFRLTPALADGQNTGALARSIRIECVIIVGILALVAGWRFTPPPRATAMAAPPPLALHIHSDRAMFQVLVSPGTAGIDNVVLQIMAGDASPMDAREVSLVLSLPEKGIEPFERKASRDKVGTWSVRDVPIPYGGRWLVRVNVLVTDFDQVTLEEELDVPGR